ncbi:MAG: hypothetical protein LBB94_05365 [Clostridiales bacterium]|jgi:hypothetical protein|nr:hypothetical protein [Clostridiales bacterium]
MSSSGKTANKALNQWQDTDRPKISDFNADNQILDQNALPYSVGSYPGDGAASKSITLDFTPSFALVFQSGTFGYIFTFSGEYTKGYLAMGTQAGATPGLTLNAGGFTVSQASSVPSNGMHYRMNESGKTYSYIAFK